MLTVSTPSHAYLSWGDHIHGHCPSVDSILCRIPVSHSASVSTAANCHGHSKASQLCLRCCSDNFVTPSLSERVRCNHTCSVDIHLSLVSSQVVLVHRYRYVCLKNRQYKRNTYLIYSYAKWTPGNPGQSRWSLRQLFG